MIAAQKIQIGLGVITSLTTLIFLCCFAGFFLSRNPIPSDAESMTVFLFVAWLFSLMIAIGSYFNTVKQSKIGLIALLIGAIFIAVTLGFWSFILLMWTGIFGLFPLVPTILSVLTAFSALIANFHNGNLLKK